MRDLPQNSINLRRPKEEDVPQIQKIAEEKEFPLPEKFESAGVISRGDKVLAFGVLRSNIEAIIYCDGSRRDKVESLVALIEQAKEDSKALGFSEVYVFAEDEQFAKFLVNRFKFRLCKGVPLILDLDNE